MNNEPVAIVKLGGDVEWLTDVLPYNAKLYTHPVDAVNISEQYVDKKQNNRHDLGVAEAIGFDKGYAAAQAKTLTDEEIHNLMDEIEVLVHGDIKRAMYRMARKVESILNE